jgi:hypothetical protein
MGQLTDHSIQLKPEYANDPTALAAKRILETCNRHQGGSTRPLNEFLLSLYNGGRWAPDMQLLCYRIDSDMFQDVIEVMRGYAKDGRELQEYFLDGNRLFEGIAEVVPLREPGGFLRDEKGTMRNA